MPANALIPMIISERPLGEIRAFYADRLGWTPVIEMDTYLQVRSGDADDDPQLAFMPPLPPQSPLGAQPAFTRGLVVSVPVDDADAYRKRLVERGLDVDEPTDKPWGWRSVLVDDPSGVVLDFFHVIADDADQDAAS